MEDGKMITKTEDIYDLIVLTISKFVSPKLTFIVIKIKILPITTPDL